MLEIIYWVKGLLIGFIFSAPFGPVQLLCIKRVVNGNIFQGFASGVGASLGNGLYALMAAFGLSFIIQFLQKESFWFKLLGAILLLVMGVYCWGRKMNYEELQSKEVSSKHIGEALTTAFFLNIANPLTLIVYLGIFSGFGLAYANHNFYAATSLVIGVTMGAALWWFLFIELIAIFKKKLTPNSLLLLNKSLSVLVILFGVFVLITAFFDIKILGKNL
jgi:threonine/homoserine/homoserine lactone efflux protein